MDVFGVLAYLFAFTMFASICWALLLVKGPSPLFPRIVWVPFLIVACMLVGYYLAALVALSYGLKFEPNTTAWMDDPVRRLSVMFSTLLAGGGFTFGLFRFLGSMKIFAGRSVQPSV